MRSIIVYMMVIGLLLMPVSIAVGENEAATPPDISATQETRAGMNETEITIKDNIFVFQINQMEKEPGTYIGKTISLEGAFGVFHYGQADDLQTYYKVYRYYPGDCCTVDVTGLEVTWPVDVQGDYPEDGAWVRAQGMLGSYELDGVTYLQVSLTKLDVLQQQGELLVTE